MAKEIGKSALNIAPEEQQQCSRYSDQLGAGS